jgi:hypothetical protein
VELEVVAGGNSKKEKRENDCERRAENEEQRPAGETSTRTPQLILGWREVLHLESSSGAVDKFVEILTEINLAETLPSRGLAKLGAFEVE